MYNPKIAFSKQSGFYDTDFFLEIKGNGEIYYTLDGSIPTKKSNRYTKPIHITDASDLKNTNSMNEDVSIYFDNINDDIGIDRTYKSPEYLIDKCNIVRAISFLENGKKTQVISASYFVGFKNKVEYENIGIISLITDPKNLFDKKNGIYVLGKNYPSSANFNLRGMISERIAYIDVFNEKRDLILQKNIGIRIHGNSTRKQYPKSLNFYFRKEYDQKNNFYGTIIDEKYNPKELTLLYPVTDTSRIKDFLIMSLYKSKNVATMKFKPYLLFLNGEYWGFYYLTEKYGKDYISNHYKIKKKKYIVMTKTGEEYFDKFEKVLSFINDNDFDKKQNYDYLCNMIDIDSFVEYLSLLIYTNYEDVLSNNCGVWKLIGNTDKNQYCKWHFMLYDMDSICRYTTEDDVVLKLIKDDRFKKKFYNALMKLSTRDLSPERVNEFIDENGSYIKKYVINDYKRFYGIDKNEGNDIFEESINEIISFFDNRSNEILKYF
jgi:hypothetical protein